MQINFTLQHTILGPTQPPIQLVP